MKSSHRESQTYIGGVFDCYCDEFFTLIQSDNSLYELLGYTKKEFQDTFNNQLFYAIYDEERLRINDEIKKQVKDNGIFMYENRLVCKDKSIKWIWISAQLLKTKDNQCYYHCLFHDITENKKNEETLQISEQRLDFILSQTQDIIFEYDCLLNEIYYSDNFEKKFGYQIPAKGFPDSMFKTNIIHQDDVLPLRNGFQSLLSGKNEMKAEYRLKYKNKGYRWVHVQATSLHDDNQKLVKIIGVITDIHDQKQELIKSKLEAALDPLTGLLNRRECIRRMEDYISVTDTLFAFILIDIDNFKVINDVYGHPKGDLTLKKVSEKLTSIVRISDVVARIGGDEFVVCLMNIQNIQIVINKVEQIQNIFSEDLKEELGFSVNCSIGISLYPKDGMDFTTLLEYADIALYQAKENGKGKYYIYDQGDEQKKYNVVPQQYMQKTFHDHIIEYVIQMLLENPNKHEAINTLLKTLGEIFNCDRISIFEKKDNVYTRSFQYISDSIYDVSHKELTIANELLSDIEVGHKMLTYENVAIIQNICIRNWFMQRTTISTAVCLMKGLNHIQNLICYENCHSHDLHSGEEYYTLNIISSIIQLYLNSELEI